MSPERSRLLRCLVTAGATQLERLGQLLNRRLSETEARKDRAARRMRERGEREAEGIGGHNSPIGKLTSRCNKERSRRVKAPPDWLSDKAAKGLNRFVIASDEAIRRRRTDRGSRSRHQFACAMTPGSERVARHDPRRFRAGRPPFGTCKAAPQRPIGAADPDLSNRAPESDASFPLFPADPQGDAKGGGDRLASADAARRHDPTGGGGQLRLAAARASGSCTRSAPSCARSRTGPARSRC